MIILRFAIVPAESSASREIATLNATTHVQHLALAQHEEHRLLCLYPSKNGNKVWKVTVEGSNDAEQTAEEIQQQAEVQTPEEEPKPKANILVHYSYCLLKITCKNIFFRTKLPQFKIFVVTLYRCFILVLN